MRKKVSTILLSALAFSALTIVQPAASANTAVQYLPSDNGAVQGEEFEITVYFDKIDQAICYAVMLDDSFLDASGVSFVDVKEIGELKASLFAPDPNDANDVAAAYGEPVQLEGEYVKYSFKVSETAAVGSEIALSFLTVVYDCNNKEIAGSQTETVTLTVEKNEAKFLKGDVDGSGAVDIADAILLFQHSMVPAFYPIEYPGTIDFNLDQSVDILDAVLLFQHSMVPDLYPLPD